MTTRIAQERLHNQGLSHLRFENPQAVVRWHGAMQAQEYHSAKWALAVRTKGYTDKTLDKLFDDGAFVRTHVMRPTWHFVAPADIRWLLKLTAPRVHQANAYMYRKAELDEKILHQCHEIITKSLEGGKEKTRPELAKDLAAAGIQASDIRLTYIVMHAELEGLICNGARLGKQFTYALLEERIPAAKTLDMDEALAELCRRYFQSHAPATIQDFSWWSGLTIAEIKRGLALLGNEFVEENGYWRLAKHEAAAQIPFALLLPAYDEYGVAYKDHSTSLAPEFLAQATTSVFGGTIVIEGMVIGYWRRTLEKKAITMELMPFRPLNVAEEAAITLCAEAYGAFHALPIRLSKS